MTRVLVCWEDQFHAKLDLCLRRALRRGASVGPELFFDGLRGNGNFPVFIERDWPKAAQRGLPKSAGPIDHLICVADADRATQCCAIEPPPAAPASTTDWVRRADEAWTQALRKATTLDPARIHGLFLRWNQESLLIAAHDVSGVLQKLRCPASRAVQDHLSGCKPSPIGCSDADFTDLFRKSGRCLEDMLKAAGQDAPRKGSVPRDDALDEASRVAIERLCTRVPDLLKIAHHIRALATTAQG